MMDNFFENLETGLAEEGYTCKKISETVFIIDNYFLSTTDGNFQQCCLEEKQGNMDVDIDAVHPLDYEFLARTIAKVIRKNERGEMINEGFGRYETTH